MRATRRALKRAKDGAFAIVHEHEWAALQPLALWATRLFLLLVKLSDFKTGAGQATYTLLAECLTPAQPAAGKRQYAPDAQAVKRMVLELEHTRIVARDTRHSHASKLLFFDVAPRYVEARPPDNSTHEFDPSKKLSQQALARPAARSAEKLDPSIRPPLQESISLHMERPSYPHVDKSKADLKRVRNEIAARRRGVEK